MAAGRRVSGRPVVRVCQLVGVTSRIVQHVGVQHERDSCIGSAGDGGCLEPSGHLHFFSPRTLGVVGARHGLALIECRFPYLGTPYESEADDGARFLRDANLCARDGSVATAVSSPPFPGTMMSLVLRQIE